jgi:SepF-like predicted cell division protein (DUF552 family)
MGYFIVCHFMDSKKTLILLKDGPERSTSDEVEETDPNTETVERSLPPKVRESYVLKAEAYHLKKQNGSLQNIVREFLVFDAKRLENFGLTSQSLRRDAEGNWNPEDVERLKVRQVQLIKQDAAGLKDVVDQHRKIVEKMKGTVLSLLENPVETVENAPA